jgi:hypothetical protein
MTSRAEEYQRYARQCVQIAPIFQDEEMRAILLDQAQVWLHLAHLAQANRHIAELMVEIVRQREIVKHALDTGQRSEIAASLLDALEGSLRLFGKHRSFLLSCQLCTHFDPRRHDRGRALSRAPEPLYRFRGV